MSKKILIIGLVWPEPTSSAAGWRMIQLIDFFRQREYSIYFASAAKKSAHSFPLATKGIKEQFIDLNNSSFDEYITGLQPEIVLFDRFITEEQLGWRVRNTLPKTITILDTEDLHFVRKAREKAYKANQAVNYFSADAKREIASILRCDLSLIISQFEMNLLIDDFHISPKILQYLPFFHQEKNVPLIHKEFADRHNFMFIGNCLHEPNYQTILKLKKDIWPSIKKQLPDAELHIFGAYMSEKVMQLHQPKTGFIIKGRADNVIETMNDYRVMIAPIPFGAGIKGKFVDAMQAGLPNVSSSIGAEDMQMNGNWGGFIADEDALFIGKSIELYQNQAVWENAQKKGFTLFQTKYQDYTHFERFNSRLQEIVRELAQHRQQHFIGQILQDNQHNALKYMSKWIEEKNK